MVQGNTISDTAAESIDIKEGTTGGAVIDNTFDGSGMTGGGLVGRRQGQRLAASRATCGATPPKDGFQTHQIVDGWGSNNVFIDNTAKVDGPGVDFYVHDPETTATSSSATTRRRRSCRTSNVTCRS